MSQSIEQIVNELAFRVQTTERVSEIDFAKKDAINKLETMLKVSVEEAKNVSA